MQENTGPLAGIRIVDLTQFLSGPFCTQILADLGAEIIKIEAPQGDLARHIPPYFVADDSAYYLSVNRNKRSLGLDLKTKEGAALLRQMIDKCDVVIENFRPGVLERLLGVTEAELRGAKPELIWCSISGFGQTGPYRDKPAYDMIVQALSGGMSLTGEPGRAAVRAGIPIGDLAAGMYAVMGVLAALVRRGSNGRGNSVDISMLDCQAALLCYQAAYHLHSGNVPGRQGSGHDSIPTYRSFAAGDGREIVITANTERMWQGLCEALELHRLIDDPRFTTNKLRYANRFELWPILEDAFLTKSADYWVEALERKEVPVGVVNTLDRVVADPQIASREMVLEIDATDGRATRVMGNPIKLREDERQEHSYPPALGEDSVEILEEVLGLKASEIGGLIDKGVVLAQTRKPEPALPRALNAK